MSLLPELEMVPYYHGFDAPSFVTVWLQLGIRHEAAADRLTTEGVDVVRDRCLLVEHRRWVAGH
jgi:predicted CoA-binding protein